MNCANKIRARFIRFFLFNYPPAFAGGLIYFKMPLLTFDKVLKIISTILNILSAALNAFGSSWSPSPVPPEMEEEGHS